MSKLSQKVYSLNLGVPKEFEDMSAYSAFLGNGVVGLEQRIKELEAALVKEKDAQIHYYNAAMDHAKVNKELEAELSRIQSIADNNAAQCMALEAELTGIRQDRRRYKAEIDRLQAELRIFKQACDPRKLDYQALKALKGG